MAKVAGAQKAAEEEKAAADAEAARKAAEAEATKPPGSVLAADAADGSVHVAMDIGCGPQLIEVERLQQLANSGSGDEASAVQTTLCLLGIDRKVVDRSSPY